MQNTFFKKNNNTVLNRYVMLVKLFAFWGGGVPAERVSMGDLILSRTWERALHPLPRPGVTDHIWSPTSAICTEKNIPLERKLKPCPTHSPLQGPHQNTTLDISTRKACTQCKTKWLMPCVVWPQDRNVNSRIQRKANWGTSLKMCSREGKFY